METPPPSKKTHKQKTGGINLTYLMKKPSEVNRGAQPGYQENSGLQGGFLKLEANSYF